MITFEQIQKANEGLSSIDVKGKDYVMVPERVKAFRILFPEGFIKTDILSMENGVCVMKTKVGYYDNGHEVILGTGLAHEKEANGYINKTSYIENCETSSVGRALGFLALGIDGGGICSAEELANAIKNQQTESTRYVKKDTSEKDTAILENSIDELGQIRAKLDAAIKKHTMEMTKSEKIKFLNTIVMPTLDGERNWRLCENIPLLKTLLFILTEKAA